MNFDEIRLLLDGLYTKYLLNSSYSINTNSPEVMVYQHITNMLDRATNGELEKANETLRQENYRLKNMRDKETSMEQTNSANINSWNLFNRK